MAGRDGSPPSALPRDPAAVVLLAAAAALPFHDLTWAVGRVGLRPFETLLGVACLLAAPRAARCWRAWIEPRLVDREVLAVVLLGALAVFLFPGPGQSLRELRLVVLEPALYYLLLTRLLPERSGAWLAGAIVLGGVAASLVGVAQIALGSGIEAEGVERARGAYSSPNNLALYLDRAIPIAAALALSRPLFQEERVSVRAVSPAVWGIATLVMLLGQALTFSLGGWSATALALVVVAAFLRPRLLATLASAGLVAAVALGLWRPERITANLSGASGSTSALRVYLWRGALEMLWDHPLFGVGLDNFVYLYNPARGGSYLDPAGWREPDLSHPHNLVLDWWLSLGVAGFLLLARLLARFYQLARAALSGGRRPLAVGAVGAMAAAVVHGLTDNSFFLPDLAALWWVTYVLVRPPSPAARGGGS